MKIKSLLFASACLLSLQAQSGFAKFYGRLDLGGALPLSFDKTPTTPIDAQGYGGKRASASLSYGFGVGIETAMGFRSDISVMMLDQFKFNKAVDLNTLEPYTESGTTPAEKSFQKSVSTPVTQKIGANVVLANFYYDFAQFGNFVPYVGAGIGVAIHDVRDYIASYPKVAKGETKKADGNKSDIPNMDLGASQALYKGKRSSALAFSVGLGGSYKISEVCALEIGYMYQDLGRISTVSGVAIQYPFGGATSTNPASVMQIEDQASVTTKLRAHNIKFGVRISF